ncbi:MAG: hypothetical protein WCO94_15575 [Verrucomicrobiota bacterium]
MNEKKKVKFARSHGSRRELSPQSGLSGGGQRAVPAEAALADLWRFLNDKFLEARREYIHCFGKVAGKGPEYFDGYNVALAEVEEWVNAKLTARDAGGNGEVR